MPVRQGSHVPHHDTDIAIIGAGPAGLFAAYYAGFRGLRVAVIDSLPELGGQVTAMYPEKLILDVAGFPAVKGRDLVGGLVEQANTAEPEYLLDRTATDLSSADDDVTILTDHNHLGDGLRDRAAKAGVDLRNASHGADGVLTTNTVEGMRFARRLNGISLTSDHHGALLVRTRRRA